MSSTCPDLPHFRRIFVYDKSIIHLPRQEANTSLEMLIFTRENANCRWIYRDFTENQKIDKKSSAKKLKNRLIISHNLYILWVEVNVCRLLMVRGISDSVRKWCHLLYRWDINGIVRKCSPSADVGGDLHNTQFAQRRTLQYMEIRQGYSYHIKDEFFDMVQDKYLMSNKENGNYRPHFYAIQDKKN